ncbi:MAG: hypothetical protein LBG62_02365 [Candidatus Methanoplasma sp.]|jgi:hypothetical protein|nr:hypothetical protein [Candidatus Methanoplasma sp.]
MKTNTKLAIASASLCLAMCVAAVAMEAYYILGSAIVALFSSLAMLYAVGGGEGKCRHTAMYLSRVPGLGHVYLGCGRRSIPFFIGDVASVSTFALMALFPADVLFGAFLFVAILFYIAFASVVDVEMVCDRMGFPRMMCGYELNVRRGRLGLLVLTVALTVSTVAVSLLIFLAYPTPGNNMWLHLSVSGVLIALTAALAADYAGNGDAPLERATGCEGGGAQ